MFFSIKPYWGEPVFEGAVTDDVRIHPPLPGQKADPCFPLSHHRPLPSALHNDSDCQIPQSKPGVHIRVFGCDAPEIEI